MKLTQFIEYNLEYNQFIEYNPTVETRNMTVESCNVTEELIQRVFKKLYHIAKEIICKFVYDFKI